MAYKHFLHIGGVLHGRIISLPEQEFENTGFVTTREPVTAGWMNPPLAASISTMRHNYKRQTLQTHGRRVDLMIYDQLSLDQALEIALMEIGTARGVLEIYCTVYKSIAGGWHPFSFSLDDALAQIRADHQLLLNDPFMVEKGWHSDHGLIKAQHIITRKVILQERSAKEMLDAELLSKCRTAYKDQASTPAGSSSGGSMEITEPPSKLAA